MERGLQERVEMWESGERLNMENISRMMEVMSNYMKLRFTVFNSPPLPLPTQYSKAAKAEARRRGSFCLFYCGAAKRFELEKDSWKTEAGNLDTGRCASHAES